MSFSVSAENGRYEYSGDNLGTLLGTARQWASPSHWRMIADLVRFYRSAEQKAPLMPEAMTLGQFLEQEGYGRTFYGRVRTRTRVRLLHFCDRLPYLNNIYAKP